MTTYAFVFLIAFALALVTTPLVQRLGQRYGVLDLPSKRKVHERPIPRIGGVAIFLSVLVAIVPVFGLSNDLSRILWGNWKELLGILVGAFLMLTVGLVDDIVGLRAITKLASQVIAAVVAVGTGSVIEAINLPVIGQVHFGPLGPIVTVVWIVGLINAVNLIDGLDGLAAGLAAMACAVIAILAVTHKVPLMGIVALALLGSLLGFLPYNFNPASIFMGDSGSQFLGYVLATISVVTSQKTTAVVAIGLVGVVLGVPILDTVTSIVRRLRNGQGVFQADRGHFHHLLMDVGLSHKTAVLFIYLLTLGVTAIACSILFVRSEVALLAVVLAFVPLLLAWWLVGTIARGKDNDE